MSEDGEGFLARWSRRKVEIQREEVRAPDPLPEPEPARDLQPRHRVREARRGGDVDPGDHDEQRVTMRGRDLLTGLPRSVELTADQVGEAPAPQAA